MLFAIEVLIGGFRSSALQVIVVSAVVGSVTAREVIGPDIIYQPAVVYTLGDARELLLYALLGVAAAGTGTALLLGQRMVRRQAARLAWWPPLTIAAGGLGVGLVAMAMPEVLGTGDRLPAIAGLRDPIQAMLDSETGAGVAGIAFLLGLAAAKIIATSLSTGTGNAVGVFAPAIMCGAAVGGAIGNGAALLMPTVGVQPGAFALAGMAGVFAASARAPLTAIVLAFELTRDYDLVLPLMLTAGLAVFIADRLQPESVYSVVLHEQGVEYTEPDDIDIMQIVRVSEVMTSQPDVLDAAMTVREARAEFDRTRHHGFPVVSDGRLVGVCTLTDMARASTDSAGRSDPEADSYRTVHDICTRDPVTVTPVDPVFRALRRMATLDIGRLPVVAADDHSRLVGMIRRPDLVSAYRRAVTRSLARQQRSQLRSLRELADTQYLELTVGEGAPAADTAVRDVAWPQHTLLVSIHRRGTLIRPAGGTVLTVGDDISVVTDRESAEQVTTLLTGQTDTRAVEE